MLSASGPDISSERPSFTARLSIRIKRLPSASPSLPCCIGGRRLFTGSIIDERPRCACGGERAAGSTVPVVKVERGDGGAETLTAPKRFSVLLVRLASRRILPLLSTPAGLVAPGRVALVAPETTWPPLVEDVAAEDAAKCSRSAATFGFETDMMSSSGDQLNATEETCAYGASRALSECRRSRGSLDMDNKASPGTPT